MSDSHELSIVIPAYNEGARLGSVLEAALASEVSDNVIVVDDSSNDETAKVASGYGVAVLRHEQRLGKGDAMHTGYLHAFGLGSTALLFLDADLHNLKPAHVMDLARPVAEGTAPMTIGILERTRFQKALLLRWGAFSGQRAVTTRLWESLSPSDRRGFAVEAALNRAARQQGIHRDIQRILLSGVTHTGKREKEPTLAKAGIAYARTYGAALLTYARIR